MQLISGVGITDKSVESLEADIREMVGGGGELSFVQVKEWLYENQANSHGIAAFPVPHTKQLKSL